MAADKKKINRPARIPPRDKQSHAQYVWIKEMFARQTRLEGRIVDMEKEISDLKESVKFIKDEITKIEQIGD
jgi:predicted  nucleic acid-binding Zn-ribbon protein